MKTIEFEGIKITIGRANAVSSTRRSVLAFRGSKDSATEPEEIAVLRTISYPDCTSPVISSSGILQLEDGSTLDFSHPPLNFEEFCRIPDQLLILWEATVYEVNPHWNPTPPAPAEVEKKK